MQLYFLRHGPAGQPGDPAYPDDADRPLTPRGRRRTRQAARGVRRLGLKIDAVLTSPLIRARQTADIVVEVLRLEPSRTRITMGLSSGGLFETVIDELLKDQPDAGVLLVGHEPDLSRFVSRLVSGEADRVSLQLKKAGLCGVEAERMPPDGHARLMFLLQPRQLRAIG